MKLSIVVPCYNESANIPTLLERFHVAIQRDDVQVLLVNNGSTDDSQIVMESLLDKYPFAQIVKVDVNQGYGYGILSGLRAATTDYLGWTHADLQTDPLDVIKALEIIEQMPQPEKLFVKGRRQGRPWPDQFFTNGMSFFETLYLGTPLSDINAQPNIFHRSFFESWDNPPHDFSLDLYAFYMARQKKLEVHRFPVIFPERIHGHSHWNVDWKSKWKFIKRTLDFSRQLKQRLQ